MLTADFRTDDVPVTERFGAWVDLHDQAQAPMRVRSGGEGEFQGSLRTLAMDDVLVSVLDHPTMEIYRSPRLIRVGDPEAYALRLALDGTAVVRQSGREAVLRPGQFALLDTSLPFEGQHQGCARNSCVAVQIPRARLTLPRRRADRLTAVTIDARRGLGAVFSRWLTTLTSQAHDIAAADEPALARTTVELLNALLTTSPHGEVSLEAHHRALRASITAFAEHHLGDPRLGPRAIAEAHHISLRHLHRLFADEETTPAAWIRRRRLERCHRDLADPALRHLTIGAIAGRWGFVGKAHFTRAFREAYGTTPRDFRRQHAL